MANGLVQITITRTTGLVEILGAVLGGSCFIESKMLDLENPRQLKFIDFFTLELEEAVFEDARFTLKHRKEFNDTDVVEAFVQLKGLSYPKAIRPPDDNFWAVRLDDIFVVSSWKLGALELYGGPSGDLIG